MIITCPNCKKQFKINASLIPEEGRDVQCGSCNNVWFYQIESENLSTLKLNDEINVNITESGTPVNRFARIVMPDTQGTSNKVSSVKISMTCGLVSAK